MSLTKYVFVSFAVAGGLVYHALKTREQYFPAMLYLSTSKLSVVVLGNLAFALTLCFGHILKQIFLGQLREAEIERLYERAKDAIMETCLAMTIFREEFNVKFVVMFVSLLFVKIFHWLAGDRVEFMEQSPTSTRLQHVRVISLVAVLVTLDVAFLGYAVTHTLKRGPSVLLLFGFEYVILASRAVAVAAKYVIGRIDGFLDGRWDGKGTCVFYLELMTDLLHLFVYFVFFLIIFAYYGLPVHLVRDLYVTFRNFRRRVADFLRYRKVTANLNERFPDCSREELESGDDVCIICREDMRCDGTGGSRPKKLPCGHYFHLGCLRSWLERQQACPTCRAPVLPEEEADAAARRGANDAENDAADAAMRAAFERQLFGGNGPNAGGEANPPAERAGGDAGAPPLGNDRAAAAASAAAVQEGDADTPRRAALEAAARRAASAQAAVHAGAMPTPLAQPSSAPPGPRATEPPPPPPPAASPSLPPAPELLFPPGEEPFWMRTPGHENRGSLSSGGTGSSGGRAERLPSSPWTSLAATAAGDVAAGAAFSPAQAHQIAAATAAAVAAATAAAAAHPGHREPTVNNVFASPSSFFRGDEISGADKSAPTPAQTAVARAEVALLEAKMEALREQLEFAAEASARMEARARAAAAAREGENRGEKLLSEGGDKKERGDKDDKAARGEKFSPAETFEDEARLAEKGKAPVSSPDSRPDPAIARVEEGVPSAGESESESSEEIRRRRVERFGEGSE
jgi:E3 ubiquitin-protein ligase synoviolin